MGKDPGFDSVQAHRYFSVTCFNKAWEFIEKPNRTREEDEEMIRLSQASLWHWTQRDDCKNAHLATAFWQLARVLAIAGRSGEARHFADLCLRRSEAESPFSVAYAYEALARAEKTAGNVHLMEKYKTEAARLTEAVAEADERKLLMDDLATL